MKIHAVGVVNTGVNNGTQLEGSITGLVTIQMIKNARSHNKKAENYNY